MKPKQAAGLLTNNQKYLTHICVKGTKGSDYSKVLKWYLSVYPHVNHLIKLLVEERDKLVKVGNLPSLPAGSDMYKKPKNNVPQKSLYKTLNIFKPGFYSTNEEVVNACASLYIRIAYEINSLGGEIVGETWGWFVNST